LELDRYTGTVCIAVVARQLQADKATLKAIMMDPLTRVATTAGLSSRIAALDSAISSIAIQLDIAGQELQYLKQTPFPLVNFRDRFTPKEAQ